MVAIERTLLQPAISLALLLVLSLSILARHSVRNTFTITALFLTNAFMRDLVIIIVLLAKTPRSEMHPASYVFGSDGLINGTSGNADGSGGWNQGLAFLFGLLSVQWTVKHISEHCKVQH